MRAATRIVDVVPNHMTVPQPTPQRPVVAAAGGGTAVRRVVRRRLGRRGRPDPHAVSWEVEQAIENGDIVLATDGGPSGREWVIWHYGDEFPVPGNQHHRSPSCSTTRPIGSSWREAADALNYRRFFDVTSLVAVRVEDPVVFASTHALLLSLFGHGAIDGFRIDHPDGLADPGGYLEALASGTGDGWVVVEKILEGDEELPAGWRCAGTTGYDALLRIQQVLTDGSGEETLDRLWAERSTGTAHGATLPEIVTAAKRLVVDDVQAAEVDRLMRLVARIVPDEDHRALRRALEAMLISMDRYRAYIVPGKAGDGSPDGRHRVGRAGPGLDEQDHPALETWPPSPGGWLPQAQAGSHDVWDEFRIRFQQTCGPVMAKGIEDTAFYRWFRLVGANEVGGHPQQLSLTPEQFHEYAARQLEHWPLTMTTLTTHDTKRTEDVRARLMAVAAAPQEWETWLVEAERLADPHRTPLVDRPTEYLIWQTLVGTWPITAARIEEYLLKAVREAKVHTAWVDGDPEYEAAAVELASAVARPGDPGPSTGGSVPGGPDPRRHPRSAAHPAHDARGAGRLSGLRDRQPLARRPGQPPTGQL